MAVERPLRRDAERNRARLLDAARVLFAERGLNVTMDQIADRAGVGVGTVYRRFGSRDEIIEALFEDRMEQFVGLAAHALDALDPWEGLAGFLEQAVAMQADDRGLKELLVRGVPACERVALVRERLLPLVGQLVARARDAGQIRPDAGETDMAVISLMLGTVADFAHDVQPDLWRRYLAILLDGLRAGGSPLPGPALDAAGLDDAMETWRPPRPGRAV
jgi:AcrR family transcriptional regulator